MSDNQGLDALHQKVLEPGNCCGCGACLGLCPYLEHRRGRVVRLFQCDLADGRCYAYCPKIPAEPEALRSASFGALEAADRAGPSSGQGLPPGGFATESAENDALGLVRGVWAARAREPDLRERGQHGGLVSALMIHALETGALTATVLTARDGSQQSEGRVARTRTDVLTCTGSGYAVGPTLAVLNRGPFGPRERLGLVGLPCQVRAIARMRHHEIGKPTPGGAGTVPGSAGKGWGSAGTVPGSAGTGPDSARPVPGNTGALPRVAGSDSGHAASSPTARLALVVGLFCTWALDSRFLGAFLARITGGEPILKLDITPPPDRRCLIVTPSRVHRVPLDDVRDLIRPSCQTCPDMCAEYADISVGSLESREGWNTVIARSARGLGLLSDAATAGVLELEVYPSDDLAALRQAVLLKRRRAGAGPS